MAERFVKNLGQSEQTAVSCYLPNLFTSEFGAKFKLLIFMIWLIRYVQVILFEIDGAIFYTNLHELFFVSS